MNTTTPKTISLGRSVHYLLSAQDAEAIMRRRTTGKSIAIRIYTAAWPVGAQAHIGNPVQEGDVCTATVVKVNGPGSVNLQVLLDGTDVYWATSRTEGNGPGCWRWPEIVGESIAQQTQQIPDGKLQGSSIPVQGLATLPGVQISSDGLRRADDATSKTILAEERNSLNAETQSTLRAEESDKTMGTATTAAAEGNEQAKE